MVMEQQDCRMSIVETESTSDYANLLCDADLKGCNRRRSHDEWMPVT